MRMELDRRALGETIRTARMKKGLTQECLAEMLDITPIHLKKYRRIPSVAVRSITLSDDGAAGLLGGCAGVPGAGECSGDSHRRADGAGGGGAGPAGGRDEGKGIAAACVDARAAAVCS